MAETISFVGLELRFLHTKDDTDGSVDVFEMTVQPNARMPVPHYHETWDETVYGLMGTTTWRIDGQDVGIGPGQTAFNKARDRPWLPQRHPRACDMPMRPEPRRSRSRLFP